MQLNLNPEQFKHPLLNTEPIPLELADGRKEEGVELRTAATVLCYTAADDPDNRIANENLKSLVAVEDPDVDVPGLLEKTGQLLYS